MNQSYYPELPEAQSIKSMYHIVRILAIIFGILLLLAGLAYMAVVYWAWTACNSLNTISNFGSYCGASLGALLIAPLFIFIFGVIDIVIYVKMKDLEAKVNARQYEAAKSSTLIWMILGFILGGVIVGILLLIAYIKFDPLIAAARNQAAMPPPAGGWPPQGAPPPGYAAPAQAWSPPPAMAPPAPAAPSAAAPPMCPRCGKPATWVAQYGRYYCYTDSVYI